MMRPSMFALPATRDFGTARVIATASANDATSIALSPTPRGRQFWLLATGVGSNSYWYVPGATEDAWRNGTMLYQTHEGTTTWKSVALTLIRPIPGTTWGTTITLNMGSTSYEMAYGLLMEPRGDFRGQATKVVSVNAAGASLTHTVTPTGGAMRRPGGLFLAAAYQGGVGAGATSVTGEGWVGYFVGNIAIAIWICPTGTIVTPPPVVFTSARSAGWGSCWAALR